MYLELMFLKKSKSSSYLPCLVNHELWSSLKQISNIIFTPPSAYKFPHWSNFHL